MHHVHALRDENGLRRKSRKIDSVDAKGRWGGGEARRLIRSNRRVDGGREAEHKNIFQNLDLLRCIFLI